MNHIWKKLENGNFTNPNYVGCCLSHLSIYKHAIENIIKELFSDSITIVDPKYGPLKKWQGNIARG